jgi:hypothetical protein
MFQAQVLNVSSVLDVCCKCFICISIVDLGEAHVATSVPPWVTARACWWGAATACMQAHGPERAQMVPCMHGPVRPPKRDECGARELRASSMGSRAPSAASALNRRSGR